MTRDDRALGRMEEFKSWAKSEFDQLRRSQSNILNKLEALQKDRWIIYGKMTTINACIIILTEIALRGFIP